MIFRKPNAINPKPETDALDTQHSKQPTSSSTINSSKKIPSSSHKKEHHNNHNLSNSHPEVEPRNNVRHLGEVIHSHQPDQIQEVQARSQHHHAHSHSHSHTNGNGHGHEHEHDHRHHHPVTVHPEVEPRNNLKHLGEVIHKHESDEIEQRNAP